jgi:hypothetical protein
VFRAEAIKKVKMFNGMHRFLPTLLRLEGYAVRQVPVSHHPRQAGVSKYGTFDRAFRGLRDAFAVRWMQDRRLAWRVRQEKPGTAIGEPGFEPSSHADGAGDERGRKDADQEGARLRGDGGGRESDTGARAPRAGHRRSHRHEGPGP